MLEGVVCCQFQKFSAGASSGFDAIPTPFNKHACLPVRCDGKFKQVNVLVPLMAHLFRVLLSESKAPLLSVIQDMYNRDEYVLKDGDRTARVHLTRGVKPV